MGLQNLEDLCLGLGVTIMLYQSEQRAFLLQNGYGNILPSREDNQLYVAAVCLFFFTFTVFLIRRSFV
jgi:hypothetical protein